MSLINFTLQELLNEYEEEDVLNIFSSFTCTKNSDVEIFLKTKAILFEKAGKSRTTIVFNENYQIVGYFSIANSSFDIQELSNSKKKRIRSHLNVGSTRSIPAVLIGQIGKNDNPEIDTSMVKKGYLMRQALYNVVKVDRMFGVRVVYLECIDDINLINHYKSFGFEEHVDKANNRILTEKKGDDEQLVILYRTTNNLLVE